MSKSGQHHHASHQPATRFKRHHKLLVAVALVLVVAWLAWNALLVESDVAGVAVDAASNNPPAAR